VYIVCGSPLMIAYQLFSESPDRSMEAARELCGRLGDEADQAAW
jgi:hypothetical protein